MPDIIKISDNPGFFETDDTGASKPAPTITSDYTELHNISSVIQARGRNLIVGELSPFLVDGIPGVPFDRGVPNPDVFYQGEDFVYDLFLHYAGAVVTKEDYDITVRVKTSPRTFKIVWQGTLGTGVYAIDPQRPGYYEVWIPADCTSALHAGTYFLDVVIKEKVGEGKGRYDRKFVVLQHMFNVEYSNFSEHPESMSPNPDKLGRHGIEQSWPNASNTIGR